MLDPSRVSVLLDVRQPQAYLALGPTAAWAAEAGIDVDWLPIEVPVLKAPSDPTPDDDRAVRHRRYRAEATAREIAIYGAAQGLVIEGYYRDGDPSALNVAWLWVRERHPERLLVFLEEAFRSYWARELDVGLHAEVAAMLDRAGLGGPDFARWRDGAGAAQAAVLAEELRERGISRAPAYLLQDEVFIGRQHLPMIRWILNGRTGLRPI